jgi:hypothetical protein
MIWIKTDLFLMVIDIIFRSDLIWNINDISRRIISSAKNDGWFEFKRFSITTNS